MSSKFGYPGLQCILEYLEANKRIHICARSPTLRKIEKKLPLHINRLHFFCGGFIINEIDYGLHCPGDCGGTDPEHVLVDGEFRDWTEVTMPGDVFMKNAELQDNYMLLETQKLEIRNPKPIAFEFNRKFVRRESFVPDIPFDIAQKKLANVLLGDRKVIYASELIIFDEILRLPVGLNLRILHLNPFNYDIKNLVPRIDPLSFPLKTIDCLPDKPELYHHPIVQTAESFRISSWKNLDFLEPWHQTVLSLPHKHIIMSDFEFDKEQIVSVVQDWLDHPRENGKSLVMREREEELVKILHTIAKRFNGKVIMTPENQAESYYGVRRGTIYHKAILLPLQSITSQLLVTGNIRTGVKLEMVPNDSIHPIVPASLTYWDVFCSTFFGDELGFLVFMFFFLFCSIMIAIICFWCFQP